MGYPPSRMGYPPPRILCPAKDQGEGAEGVTRPKRFHVSYLPTRPLKKRKKKCNATTKVPGMLNLINFLFWLTNHFQHCRGNGNGQLGCPQVPGWVHWMRWRGQQVPANYRWPWPQGQGQTTGPSCGLCTKNKRIYCTNCTTPVSSQPSTTAVAKQPCSYFHFCSQSSSSFNHVTFAGILFLLPTHTLMHLFLA